MISPRTLTVRIPITALVNIQMSFVLNVFGTLLGFVRQRFANFLAAMGYYTRRPTKPDLPFGSLSFVIVGAGIAGLSAALALKKKGHHVVVGLQSPSAVAGFALAESPPQVVEKSKFATEQGAALTLSPNCSILLNQLDLQPESFGSDLVHHVSVYDSLSTYFISH